MNYKIYMVIAIVVISLTMGCITNTDTEKISDTVATINKPTPKIIQTIEPKIVLDMSTSVTKNIGQYYTAASGKAFLIYNIELENKGYQSFNTNPFYFKCVINNVAYDVTTAHFSMDSKLDTVDLLDGGKIKGTLAYEVPNEDQIISTLFYNGNRNYVFETKSK